MAIKYYETYPQRWESPSQDYPQGAFKNLSALGEQDGSYLEERWLNDQSGFFGALLRNAEMTPNGLVDTARKSQFYEALLVCARKAVNLGDYYTKMQVDAKLAESGTGIISQEWGDRVDRTISQKTLTDNNSSIVTQLSKKVDSEELGNSLSSINSEIATKASQEYVDQKLSEFALTGQGAYGTLSLAQADIANIPNYSLVFIVNDGANNGYYVKGAGDTLTKTDYDPLTQSKLYTENYLNSVVTVPNNTVLKSLLKYGTYLLTVGYNFVGLPDGYDTSKSGVLRVRPLTGSYYQLEIFNTDSPHKNWIKRAQTGGAETSWVYSFNDYNNSYSATDPVTIMLDGSYVISNPLNVPGTISGSILLQVSTQGTFVKRDIVLLSNPRIQYTRINTGLWVETSPFNITSRELSVDYNYKGFLDGVDLNTLTDTGDYLINNALNMPSGVAGTIYLGVNVFGSFRVQTLRPSNDMSTIYQRRGQKPHTGDPIWYDWSKIGASGGNGYSSLQGKTIAFIGDSIVEGGNYPELIGQNYGSTIHKFGFGGCRASYYPSNPLGYNLQCLFNIAKCINTGDYSSLISGAEYTRDNHSDNNVPQATAMSVLNWNNVDILVIAFGTNDWTSENGLGDLTPDPEGKTFKGALCYSIEAIQSKYPHLKIVLIGMSYRIRGNGIEGNSDTTPNTLGEYLIQYQLAMLEVAKKYHIPAYDFYSNSGVNGFTINYYLRDGVHPKDGIGYGHWGSKIGSFLQGTL